MALFVRRSILMDCSTVLCWVLLFVCVVTIPVVAQHPGMRVGGGAPPAAPMPHPPVYHAPIYQAPVYQAPIYHAPIYRAPSYAPLSTPRIFAGPVRTFATTPVRLPGPIRPLPSRYRFVIVPIFTSPFWSLNSCWWVTCEQFWTSALIYDAGSGSQWNPANYVLAPSPEIPVYGLEREDFPQLLLKDGTILNVTDYWVVNGDLHFMMIEDGIKPVEQVIPFDELDLQKTIDVNTQRGFRFMLRNEPFERYARDHPEGPPPPLPPQQP